ncbi:acetyl-CoA carboxylase biotin carboxyl carrier protein subunit [Clostridia bacterium]|nr:acetyl-CoA carboxylase biotin carboxyl carrier protein subunit [Clostridia bacterium]
MPDKKFGKIENNAESIREVARIMRENELYSLNIETEDFKLGLVAMKPSAPVSASASASSSAKSEKNASRPANSAAETEHSAGKTVVSPIIGTFYRAPGEGKEPFTEVGNVVKKGQILCIIESMKLMNELPSEHDGKVIEILAKDGETVEYGQALMIIE